MCFIATILNTMKRVICVGGARPNFMKLAPITRALKEKGIEVILVHTGQHYDPMLSDVFFKELGMSQPNYAFHVGSAPRIEQTAAVAHKMREVIEAEHPDAVLVVGDVTSTIAATMCAVQQEIPVIHVEAGLRSYNWLMPEELNRVFVDHYSRYLFSTDETATKHLLEEGIPRDRIHEVGNVMADTRRCMKDAIDASNIVSSLGVTPGGYALVTLHRGELLQNKALFTEIWSALLECAQRLPMLMPLHPRTQQVVDELGLTQSEHLRTIPSLGYCDMQKLLQEAACIYTDSGGLQEEASLAHVPCFTVRDETERPLTVTHGTNTVIGVNAQRIRETLEDVLAHNVKRTANIPLWDGHASDRIADILKAL